MSKTKVSNEGKGNGVLADVTSSGEDENLMEKRFAAVDNLIEAIVNDDMPIRAALLAATYLGQTKFQ